MVLNGAERFSDIQISDLLPILRLSSSTRPLTAVPSDMWPHLAGRRGHSPWLLSRMAKSTTMFLMAVAALMSSWPSGLAAGGQQGNESMGGFRKEDPGGVYLSVVVAGRCDDLRGNSTARLQNALDFFLVQAAALEVSMEFIIVEWNPLPAEERLKNVLKVPPGCAIPVRVITVNAEFHSRVSAGTGQSFFNELAKNVGARRSRGKFVLFTNGDNLVNMDVIRVFGGQMLDPYSFYRMPRIQIDWASDDGASLTFLQKISEIDDITTEGEPRVGVECPKATVRCPGDYNRGVCQTLGRGAPSTIAAGHQGLHDELYLQAPGDFFLASREAIHAVGGHHQVPSTYEIDALLCCKFRGAGFRQVVLVWPCLLLHERHPVSGQKPFVLPGWELTAESCERVSREARDFLRDSNCSAPATVVTQPDAALCPTTAGPLCCGGDGPGGRGCEWEDRTMNSEWGYPGENFEEVVLGLEHGPDFLGH